MATKKTKHNWKSIEKSLLSDDEKMFDSIIKFLEKNGKVEYLTKIIGLLNKLSDTRKSKIFLFIETKTERCCANYDGNCQR